MILYHCQWAVVDNIGNLHFPSLKPPLVRARRPATDPPWLYIGFCIGVTDGASRVTHAHMHTPEGSSFWRPRSQDISRRLRLLAGIYRDRRIFIDLYNGYLSIWWTHSTDGAAKERERGGRHGATELPGVHRHVVMTYVAMAYRAMAYIVMAYLVQAARCA